MKKYVTFSLFVFFVGCRFVNSEPPKVAQEEVKTLKQKDTIQKKFGVLPEQIVRDLFDKGVTVGAFQQLWVFEQKQNVKLSIIQIKALDEDQVAVAVTIDAMAVTPKEKPKTSGGETGSTVPQNKAPLPASVRLKGVAKLFYEDIGGNWYLTGITSVNLKFEVGK